MMLFFVIQHQYKGVASSCKIPSALSTADARIIKFMYSFYRYVDFGEAEAAFAVYSSCEIPLGLAYGINSTVLQCQSGF
jgi:hypothetical protein